MKNKNLPVDNNWITPKRVYDKLNDEFKFDHDPCPFNTAVITLERDGTNYLNKWGRSNFVNPPYTLKEKEAFVDRAIAERMYGNKTVLLIPVSTSTKLFQNKIIKYATEIRFVKNRIKFQKKDESGNLYTPKNGGMHDTMIVVIDNGIGEVTPKFSTIEF